MPRDQTRTVTVQEWKPVEKTYVSFKPKQRQCRFSNKEIEHLALATLLVVGVGLSLYFPGITGEAPLLLGTSIAAFTASFLVHEMAHKIVAQRNGLWAEFRLTSMGAILTAISIILPIKFISPGAVMVAGSADRKTIGRTAIAGPTINIVLATTFSVAAATLSDYTLVFGVIAWFNAWIAAINLIPFGIFDGMKVYTWDKKIWASAFILSAALTVILTITFLG